MEEKVITQTATGENPPPSASAALVVTPGHTANKASLVFRFRHPEKLDFWELAAELVQMCGNLVTGCRLTAVCRNMGTVEEPLRASFQPVHFGTEYISLQDTVTTQLITFTSVYKVESKLCVWTTLVKK